MLSIFKMLYRDKIKAILAHNLVIALVFCTLVIAGYFTAKPTSEDYDQREHHLPQIEIFVKNPLTLGESYSATVAMAPGHHVMLSFVAKQFSSGSVSEDVLSIRLINAACGLGLLLTIWWMLYGGEPNQIWQSSCLLLPLVFSPYIVGGSIWVMSDNAALLWACTALAILLQERQGGWFLSLAGIFIALAVFWRQNYIFLVIPLFWRAVQEFLQQKKWLPLLLSSLLPIVMLLYLISIWGGLVPPEFSRHADNLSTASGLSKLNFSALVYICSLIGTYGIFYLGYFWSELSMMLRSKTQTLLLLSALLPGLILSLLVPLRAKETADGILLKIAEKLPILYGRSLLIVMLCSLGTALIYLILRQFFRDRTISPKSFFASDTIIFINFVAWTGISLLNSTAFQRYFDSWIVLTISLLTRIIKHNCHAYLGVLMLSGALLILSIAKFVGFGVPYLS